LTIRIFDVTGKSRMEYTFQGETTFSMKSSGLSAGIYFYSITGGGSVVQKGTLFIY
jgi:hypothetical protein